MNGIHDLGGMAGFGPIEREDDEPLFHADWERRAFAIAVNLAEQGVFEWSEFQQQLVRAIAEAEQDDPQNPRRDYCESWLVALEALLAEKRLVTDLSH
jgi:nitrile hydratase accessory protein